MPGRRGIYPVLMQLSTTGQLILSSWAASDKRVPNVLSRCHTKRDDTNSGQGTHDATQLNMSEQDCGVSGGTGEGKLHRLPVSLQ